MVVLLNHNGWERNRGEKGDFKSNPDTQENKISRVEEGNT